MLSQSFSQHHSAFASSASSATSESLCETFSQTGTSLSSQTGTCLTSQTGTSVICMLIICSKNYLVNVCGDSMSICNDLYCLTSRCLSTVMISIVPGYASFVFGPFQFPTVVLAFLTGYSQNVGSYLC